MRLPVVMFNIVKPVGAVGARAGVIVTVAAAVLVVSASETAMTFTVAAEGNVAGAA
jgi:hypothetical protein